MNIETDIHALHVDDDENFLDLSKEIIEKSTEKITVTTENNPADVCTVIEQKDIDCIVSDYQMGDITGLDVLEDVRETYSDIPFILFTGKGTEEIASEAISCGVDDYLQKGSGQDQYNVLIKRIINTVSRRRAEAAYSEVFHRTPAGMAIHDPDTGEVIEANDRWKELLGFDGEQINSLDMETIVIEEPPYTADTVTDLINKAANGNTQRFKWVSRKTDGTEIPLILSFRQVNVEGFERVLSCCMSIRDADLLEKY